VNILKKLFGTSGASDLEVVKQLLRRASGAREFLEQAKKAGFGLRENAPTHLMLVKGECKLTIGVFASQGSDKIWFLSLVERKGAPIVNLVNGKAPVLKKSVGRPLILQRGAKDPLSGKGVADCFSARQTVYQPVRGCWGEGRDSRSRNPRSRGGSLRGPF
jgi:hypothetical protein